MFKFLFFLLLCFLCGIFANPSCPPGTKPSTNDPNICFLFKETPKSFNDSEADCVAAGGHLTPIFDQITNLMIALDANNVFKNSSDFWIGGRMTNINSALLWLWTWQNNLLKFADWAPGEPVKNQCGSCISATVSTATWNSIDCNIAKPYVCRIPSQMYNCDDGWIFSEEIKMCYKMFSNKSSFEKANDICRNQNADIISIHNDAENTLLAQLTTLGMELNEHIIGVWIGLVHSSGSWAWTDGTPYDYQNWGKYDPDHVGSSNCVVFYPDGADDSIYNSYVKKWDTTLCKNVYPRTVFFANPSCPPETKPATTDPNICFSFKETPKSFNDSEADCVAAGGHLAPIFDQFTNLIIALDADEIFKNSTNFWIGGKLTEINSALIWLWIWNDSILKFSDWEPGEPTKNQNGSCISQKTSASWISDDCHLAKPYVCRVPAKVYFCEDGWTFLEKTQMCYKMFSSSSPFNLTQGNEICQKQSANVISIHNDVENTLLGNLTTSHTPQDWDLVGVWIGLIYSNNTWTWTDGTPYDYQNWGKYDPDDVENEKCADFFPDGATNRLSYIMQWDSAPCDDNLTRIVCKKTPKTVLIF